MKERILYLEGAGCAEYNGMNCRCISARGLTAFAVHHLTVS